MRHLIVPSVDTQHWFNIVKSNNWVELGIGILTMDDGMKAIPLNSNAPDNTATIWQKHSFRVIPRDAKSLNHWTDLIDRTLYHALEDFWPKSHEVIGDVLIVKLEDQVIQHKEQIGAAMLKRMPNIRLICADNGVEGEFRVRSLEPIVSRDASVSTLTKIREHGQEILVDPTKSYFSARLSTERNRTLVAAKSLANELGRTITVCDPYAGVGPALAGLLTEPGLIDAAFVGDLNPLAVDLLKQNVSRFVRKQNSELELEIRCQDARKWQHEENNNNRMDLLLVNLPHETINHLSDLLPLMRRNNLSLIRGWAIIDKGDLAAVSRKLEQLFADHGAEDHRLSCEEIKGFSASKSYIRIESWQTFGKSV